MAVLAQGPGWSLRDARPADDAALCALFRDIHMKAALDMTQERDPDFFALHRMHVEAAAEAFSVVQDDQVVGCGSALVRPAHVLGALRPAGYLCDLRFSAALRGARVFPECYRAVLEAARDRHGAELFYTVVIDSNRRAMAALLGRDGARAGQPVARVHCPFDMTSVQFTRPKPRPDRPVTRATEADLDALVAFLDRRHRQRVFGYDFSGDLLARRLATWPGFRLSDFHLVRDRAGRIVACAAPWDTGAFKRTRVLGYHGGVRWQRLAWDLGARVAGFQPLPRPGDCFRFAFLTHLEIEGDDPALLRDLLLGLYATLRERRLHFMSAMIPRGSALAPAFRGLFVQRTPMTLLSVTLPDAPLGAPDLGTPHPGFEMALS